MSLNNQNGQLVIQTLQDLEEPSTVVQISKTIADALGADLHDVKESVKATLDGGVQYGYVQRLNNKYFLAPLEMEEGATTEFNSQATEFNSQANLETSKKLSDRSASRRRSRGRKSPGRRAGSRRRRSRSRR